MKIKFISFISILALSLGFSPILVLAAATDVQLGTGATFGATVNGSALTFDVSNGNIESLQINASSFDLTLAAGSSVTISSSNKTNFGFGGSGITSTFSCNTTTSVLELANNTTSSVTTNITPGNTCTVSGGGSGGGGGGGGGGGETTTTTTTTETTATTATAPAAQAAPIAAAPAPVTPAPAVAQPSPIAQLVSPVFNADLQIGSKGDDVKRLQELLAKDKDIYPEGLTTGTYGPLTAAAVKKFQAKYGLPQAGRVGPTTRAKLAEVYQTAAPVAQPTPAAEAVSPVFSSDLQVGSKGDDVKRLQKLLGVQETGYFGSLTKQAVAEFQKNNGLPQVGRVGPATRTKLGEIYGGKSAAPSASEEAQKQALQSQLDELQKQLDVMLKQLKP